MTPEPSRSASSHVGQHGRTTGAPPGAPPANSRAALPLPEAASGGDVAAYPRLLADLLKGNPGLGERLETAAVALGEFRDALETVQHENRVADVDVATLSQTKVLLESLLDDANAMGAPLR